MDLSGNNLGTAAPKIQEALAFGAGADPDSGQSDFAYYRPLGQTPLDASPQLHERMQTTALQLYRTNPLAHRLVKMISAFAAGGTVRIDAENRKVKNLLVTHWQHPLNDFDRRFPQLVMELGLYGEVFMLANVMDDGVVTWGDIDSLRVKRIVPDERDLARPAKAFVSKIIIASNSGMGGMPIYSGQMGNLTEFEIIRYDGRPQSETKGLRTGELLYTRTNGIRGSLRGMSDLFPLADYLDGLDTFMFALQQRVEHQNNWIWDVTLEGMTEPAIREWVQSLQGKAPRPGAIRAHNERVVWQAVAPNFSSSEATDHARLFRNYVLGAAGLADWIVGDMSSANRAATESSAAVIAKTLEQRQREAKAMLEDIFNFVIDVNIAKGTLPQKRGFDRRFYITLPKLAIRDFQRVANSLRQGAEGITKLLEAQLVDPERGKNIADQLLRQLDLEGGERFGESALEGITEDDDRGNKTGD